MLNGSILAIQKKAYGRIYQNSSFVLYPFDCAMTVTGLLKGVSCQTALGFLSHVCLLACKHIPGMPEVKGKGVQGLYRDHFMFDCAIMFHVYIHCFLRAGSSYNCLL